MKKLCDVGVIAGAIPWNSEPFPIHPISTGRSLQVVLRGILPGLPMWPRHLRRLREPRR